AGLAPLATIGFGAGAASLAFLSSLSFASFASFAAGLAAAGLAATAALAALGAGGGDFLELGFDFAWVAIVTLPAFGWTRSALRAARPATGRLFSSRRRAAPAAAPLRCRSC